MRRPLCCVCAAFVAAVFLYLECSPLPEAVYDAEDGSRAVFRGEVYQKEYRDGTLVLGLKNVGKLDENPASCRIQCYVEASGETGEPRLGSTVAVEGTVSFFAGARNPGEFDAKSYYRLLGVDFRLYRAEILAQGSRYSAYRETLYQIRRHFEGVFDRTLSRKDASIMKAMVLGNKSGLDAGSKQLFQKSGIAHILAISGLHITLLGMGLYKILQKARMPQIACAILAVGMMTAYGDMAGMSSSAHRAVLMFGMQLAARSLKRTYDMLTALAVAAALILWEQPLYIYHTGFLLSFGAILGLGCMSEVMKPDRQNAGKGIAGKAVSSLCAGVSIFLIHFPIMLCVYYEFPVYSFLLNLVVIPAMTFVMVSGLLCLGLGSLPGVIGLGTAKLAGAVCHLLLAVFERLCAFSLKLPFADWIVGRPDNWRICAFLAVVVFLYAAHHYGRSISKGAECGNRGISVGLTFPVKVITVLAAVILISSSTIDGASITFLDVGQGDCVWIESTKGEHFLIDGGSSSKSRTGEYTIVPYLKYMGVSKLDAVFLTHLDSDHISGVMEMLDSSTGIGGGIEIGRICISDAVIEDEIYEELVQLCRQESVPLCRLKTGDRIAAHGLVFEVLHPSGGYAADSRNAYSLVMKLTVKDGRDKGVTALFTGDVEEDGEHAAACALAAVDGYEGIDIYKAAHHGSRYSNTVELVSTAAPKLAVISCGEGNRYGHPHAEAVENFADAGSDILTTKDTGAVMITIKNQGYSYETYCTGH